MSDKMRFGVIVASLRITTVVVWREATNHAVHALDQRASRHGHSDAASPRVCAAYRCSHSTSSLRTYQASDVTPI